MKEQAISKAREVLRKAEINAYPVDIENLVSRLHSLSLSPHPVSIKRTDGLDDDEAGKLITLNKNITILVNDKHKNPGRQRFTIAHEVGHIVLAPGQSSLAVERSDKLIDGWSENEEERMCDQFAAEILMPEKLYRKEVEREGTGFDAIIRLSEKFQTSITSAGLHYAKFNLIPCAFVLCQMGKIIYVEGSPEFKEIGLFISRGAIPGGTLAFDLFRDGSSERGPHEIDPWRWLDRPPKSVEKLFEESLPLPQYNRVLSFIWIEEREEEEEEKDP